MNRRTALLLAGSGIGALAGCADDLIEDADPEAAPDGSALVDEDEDDIVPDTPSEAERAALKDPETEPEDLLPQPDENTSWEKASEPKSLDADDVADKAYEAAAFADYSHPGADHDYTVSIYRYPEDEDVEAVATEVHRYENGIVGVEGLFSVVVDHWNDSERRRTEIVNYSDFLYSRYLFPSREDGIDRPAPDRKDEDQRITRTDLEPGLTIGQTDSHGLYEDYYRIDFVEDGGEEAIVIGVGVENEADAMVPIELAVELAEPNGPYKIESTDITVPPGPNAFYTAFSADRWDGEVPEVIREGWMELDVWMREEPAETDFVIELDDINVEQVNGETRFSVSFTNVGHEFLVFDGTVRLLDEHGRELGRADGELTMTTPDRTGRFVATTDRDFDDYEFHAENVATEPYDGGPVDDYVEIPGDPMPVAEEYITALDDGDFDTMEALRHEDAGEMPEGYFDDDVEIDIEAMPEVPGIESVERVDDELIATEIFVLASGTVTEDGDEQEGNFRFVLTYEDDEWLVIAP